MAKVKDSLLDEQENPCEYDIWLETKDVESPDYKPDYPIGHPLSDWDGIPCDLLNG